jgi:phosphoglycolate phosphatase-like HAD superfamily hydrolase
MRRRLLLWDIDGTLIRAGDLGFEIFDLAIEAVVGRRPATKVQTGGKTDPHITREYLRQMGVPETDETVVAVLRSLERQLAARVDDLRRVGTTCPGITELLGRLASDDRVISSVLTGNIAPNAVIKLSAFGLDRWLDLSIGAYGSDHDDRNALVPVAMGRLAEERAIRLEPGDVWVIGDTPRDLDCARAAGAHCLLVATGRTPEATLGALGADAVLSDLRDTDAVRKLLLSDL